MVDIKRGLELIKSPDFSFDGAAFTQCLNQPEYDEAPTAHKGVTFFYTKSFISSLNSKDNYHNRAEDTVPLPEDLRSAKHIPSRLLIIQLCARALLGVSKDSDAGTALDQRSVQYMENALATLKADDPLFVHYQKVYKFTQKATERVMSHRNI